jgi:hypothetical protein
MLLSCAWFVPATASSDHSDQTSMSSVDASSSASAPSSSSDASGRSVPLLLIRDQIPFAPLSLAEFLRRLTGIDHSEHIKALFDDGVVDVFFTHFIQLFANPTSESLRTAWLSTSALIMPFNSVSVDCLIVVRASFSSSADVEYWPLWIQIKNYKYLSPQKMSEALNKMTPHTKSMKSASSPPSSQAPSGDVASSVSSSSAADSDAMDVDTDETSIVELESVAVPKKPRISRTRCIRVVLSVRDHEFQATSNMESLRSGDYLSVRVRGIPPWLPQSLRHALFSLCDDPRIPSAEMLKSKSSCDELQSCYSSQGLNLSASIPDHKHDFAEQPLSLSM